MEEIFELLDEYYIYALGIGLILIIIIIGFLSGRKGKGRRADKGEEKMADINEINTGEINQVADNLNQQPNEQGTVNMDANINQKTSNQGMVTPNNQGVTPGAEGLGVSPSPNATPTQGAEGLGATPGVTPTPGSEGLGTSPSPETTPTPAAEGLGASPSPDKPPTPAAEGNKMDPMSIGEQSTTDALKVEEDPAIPVLGGETPPAGATSDTELDEALSGKTEVIDFSNVDLGKERGELASPSIDAEPSSPDAAPSETPSPDAAPSETPSPDAAPSEAPIPDVAPSPDVAQPGVVGEEKASPEADNIPKV